jgi:hypothetical protein
MLDEIGIDLEERDGSAEPGGHGLVGAPPWLGLTSARKRGPQLRVAGKTEAAVAAKWALGSSG